MIMLTKDNMRLKKNTFADANLLFVLGFSCVWTLLIQMQCCTRCATEQVYYVRKAIQMELVIWCKHQNLLFYKSCTMVKTFWGHNIVCSRNQMKTIVLIDNLPLNHYLCEKSMKLLVFYCHTSGHFSWKQHYIVCKGMFLEFCTNVGTGTYFHWACLRCPLPPVPVFIFLCFSSSLELPCSCQWIHLN